MKKLTRVHPPLMSEAFIIWLVRIGYRGVVIMANGKLNKIAVRLYEEFKKHDPFNEVA